MDYNDYLRSNYWKGVKRDYKAKKKKFRCYVCKTNDEEIHVHHKRYVDKFGDSILYRERDRKFRDLMYLCKTCHFKLHELNLEDLFTSHRMVDLEWWKSILK